MTGHQAGRPRVLRGFPTQEGTWKPVLEESEARRKLKAKPWKLCGRSCPAAWEQAAEVRSKLGWAMAGREEGFERR